MTEPTFQTPPRAPDCPQCGAALAPGVPLGLCRSCVATAWLENMGGEAPEPEDEAPVRFGGFELREQLGRGGMGVVFRAWQPALQREVALKLVSSGRFAGAEEFQRLRLEAEAAARLNHPGIVSIYEAGEQDGQPWLAMQFVDGGTLSSHVGEYAGRPREAVSLLAEISRAVHHAHQHGVLHRDLKPGNILLDREGRPLVSDFGLARLTDSADGVTLTGRAVGSPAYMAPEAFNGEASVARDVYALGVILFQLLTDRLPFDDADSGSLIRRCIEEEPPRLRALRPDIPRDLEVIALKCLEKSPSHRYASAQALADDLTNWLEHRPIKARPVSLAGRTVKWARRHPGQAAGIAGIVLALAAYGIHAAQVAALEAAAARDIAASNAEAVTSLTRVGLTSALREIESGYLDQARRTLDKIRASEPKTSQPSPEWSWLRARCQAQGLARVQAHEGEITAAAFSPDGELVATTGQDKRVHVWKTSSLTSAGAKPTRTITTDHLSAVIGMAFSPDGSRLFTARNGEPRIIQWFDLSAGGPGEPVTIEAPPGLYMLSAGLSGPGGRPVISFHGAEPGKNPLPRIFSSASAAPEFTELPVPAAFTAARTDTPVVLCGNFEGGLHLLEPAADGAFKVRWSDNRKLFNLTAIASSRSGRRVAAAYMAATGVPHIQVLDTTDGTQFSLTEPSGDIRSIAIAGEEWMAAGSDDRVVRLWNLNNPSQWFSLSDHARPVRFVAFNPTGDRLLSGDQGGIVCLSALPRNLVPAAGAPVAATEDLGRVAACGYKDGDPAPELIFVEPRHGSSKRVAAPGIPAAIRLTESGGIMLCQDGNRALLCDLSKPDLRAEQTWQLPAQARIVSMTPAGEAFVTLQAKRQNSLTLRSHRMTDGGVIAERSLALGFWATVQFSPDGHHAAVLDAPAGLIAWLTFPELEVVWKQSVRPQTAITISPDGTRVAWAAGFRAGLLDAAGGGHLTEEMRQPCEIVSRLRFAGPDHLMLSGRDHSLLFISLAAREVTLASRRQPACSEILASADFSVWLSIDLQNRLRWFPWTPSPAPALPDPP